jgi:hypothetical protein
MEGRLSIFDGMLICLICYVMMASMVFFIRHDKADIDNFLTHADKIFFLQNVPELKSPQSDVCPVEKE